MNNAELKPGVWESGINRIRKTTEAVNTNNQKLFDTSPLVLNSYMADHGIIFSDGRETDYAKFNAGHTATINIADHKARLVV